MANIIVTGKYPELIHENYANGYRGVDRFYINFPDEYYGTNHEIITVYDQYEKLTKNDAYLHDYDFAKRLKNCYANAYPNIEREILEITYDDSDSELNGKFLGYDIIDVDDSNILKIILPYSIINVSDLTTDFMKALQIVSFQLKKLLNDKMLFNSYQEAVLGLNLIQNIFQLFGKDSKHHRYKVVKVFLV